MPVLLTCTKLPVTALIHYAKAFKACNNFIKSEKTANKQWKLSHQ